MHDVSGRSFAIAVLMTIVLPFRVAAQDVPEPVDASDGFAISLDVTADGVVAFCESGCAWTRLSASAPSSTFRVTDLGIWPMGPGADAEAASSEGGFSFVLSASGGAADLACDYGCAWKTVGATYPSHGYAVSDAGIGPRG